MTMTSEEGAIRAYLSWGNTRDRSARTAPARRGLKARFEREARAALGDQATDQQIAAAARARESAHYRALSARGRAAQT